MPRSDERTACCFRLGVADDIRKLEWGGAFTSHRDIIERAFAAQLAGQGLVLIAELEQFPVAQLWVRLAASRPPRFWAFRVCEGYQGQGIGSRLLQFGETELARRGFDSCEVGVEKSNPAARRLYRKSGYAVAYEQVETFSYVTPSGEQCIGTADQWILRKPLAQRPVSLAREVEF